MFVSTQAVLSNLLGSNCFRTRVEISIYCVYWMNKFIFPMFSIFCLLDINDCAKNPCLNGGRCVDKVNSYQCICKTGYSGVNCGTSKIYFLPHRENI